MVPRVIAAFLFIFFTCNFSYSQISDSLFNLSCEQEGLIILNEEMDVNITGKKTLLMMANISNKLTIIVNSLDGLDYFQPFKLPKRIDELYIYHAPAIRNIDWSYDRTFVKNFTATINNGGSEQRNIIVTRKVVTKRVINSEGFFGNVDQYEYYIDDLRVGDTLKLSYSLDIPFKDNWIKLLSNRIFFHGKYPKKSFKLNWCYNKRLEVDSLFVNHYLPEISVDGNKSCYHWEFSNLPGCLDEPQSRPYIELPYFIFVPKSYDFEYTHLDSYVQEFIPIYYLEALKRQNELEKENWDNVIGNKNKNNIYYQRVAKNIISHAPGDEIGTASMRYLQLYMVDSVRYDPAISYYSHNEDNKTQRAGVDLWAHQVKDNNIERVYGNIIPKLGLELFTAYPVDKRVGNITPLYNPTVIDNDLLFGVILKNKTMGFVIPKSDKNNYYFEELPFYYEQIPVLLLHYIDYPNSHEKRNFNYDFRQHNTPSSKWKDNFRKIQSKVVFDLQNNSTSFKTRIILSGQYSTLTRCVYCSGPVDSTINSAYIEPIWRIADNVQLKALNPGHPLIYYPFKTTINAEYEANDLLETNGDRFILKPGNWFKMIYSPEIESDIRFLDYYPDFIGSDSYSFMLEFDKPVKLVSDNNLVKVTNSYGQISFKCDKIGENKFLMNVNYAIVAGKIDKDSIELVREVNHAISEICKQEIEFEIIR